MWTSNFSLLSFSFSLAAMPHSSGRTGKLDMISLTATTIIGHQMEVLQIMPPTHPQAVCRSKIPSRSQNSLRFYLPPEIEVVPVLLAIRALLLFVGQILLAQTFPVIYFGSLHRYHQSSLPHLLAI
jgi:hypothetical protein